MRYRTRLYVDLDLFAKNFELLKSICPKNKILFMVKANAYGHGLLQIVRYANEELAIKEFGVATLGEAKYLRDELPDLEFEIYVFSDITLDYEDLSEVYLNKRIIPVIYNMQDLVYFLDNKSFKNFPLCLKFNTGMNRLGFSQGQVDSVIEKLCQNDRKEVYHLLSQFACSSLPIEEKGFTFTQYNNFKKIKDCFKKAGIKLERTSMANSGAIEQGFSLDETHVRPGLMLYGPTSLNKNCRELSSWKGKNISRFETYIINSKEVEKGQPIGYGAIKAPDNGVLVLLALGYGDGFSDRIMGQHINFNGKEGTIIGRVNMDMTQLFFANCSLDLFEGIENFVIWGHDPKDILNYSDQSQVQMIPYEKFCHLTDRVPRVYLGNV